MHIKRLGYLALLLMLAQVLTVPAFAGSKNTSKDGKKKFELQAINSNYINTESGPSLSRDEIDNAGDPFGEKGFDAPEAAFDVQGPQSEQAPFNLNADQGGGFDGQNMPPAMDQAPPVQQVQEPMQRQAPTAAVDPNDPDSSHEMQLAWDQWHRRVAEGIYFKFNALAKTAFARNRSKLCCQVAYTVTRNHQVGNIIMIRKSPNLIFNTMVYAVVKSMNGNPILEFPMGSRRMSVDKTGTFLWNFQVDGFKYQTGDSERVGQ
ncbi:MAG: hypothetical protein AB7W16_27450 [Candidatus Obscuribacterales bacterium]